MLGEAPLHGWEVFPFKVSRLTFQPGCIDTRCQLVYLVAPVQATVEGEQAWPGNLTIGAFVIRQDFYLEGTQPVGSRIAAGGRELTGDPIQMGTQVFILARRFQQPQICRANPCGLVRACAERPERSMTSRRYG